MAGDRLARYNAKRDFSKTAEPSAIHGASGETLSFAIQKHAASRLHYDLRLELDGALLSWAMPKGPSFDPKQQRIAIRTEDHPMLYASFEGSIPAKQYGAGSMFVWDRGTWEPTVDPHEGLEQGKLIFHLHGEKLAGLWELVRIQKPGEKQEPWMMFKKRDEWARPSAEYDVITALPDSVITKPLGRLEDRSSSGKTKPRTSASTAQVVDALAALPGSPLPATFSPQLATLATALPTVGEWEYEIKFDGYRILARIEAGHVQLFTRNGHDWTAKMESLAREVERVGLTDAWLDCEAVVMGDDGLPSFNALQNAFDRVGTENIQLFVFDLPFMDGRDLRSLDLRTRRALLRERLSADSSHRVRFSEEFGTDGASVLKSACQMGLEGIMAKRLDSSYESRRTETWLKLKCHQRQEFVIGGFTDRGGSKDEVGSLLLGVYANDGKLRSAGSVGTGWDAADGSLMWKRLKKLEVAASPFDPEHAPSKGRWSKRAGGSERWIKPVLIAEVSFAEWTPDGSIRHAKFEGLRDDKAAKTIRREVAGFSAAPVAKKAAGRNNKGSNADCVIDASTGLTSSTWSDTTRASPNGSCRTSRTGRRRWYAARPASVVNCSSRSMVTRSASLAFGNSTRRFGLATKRCSKSPQSRHSSAPRN